MISWRSHLVSIVAVFLALGLGLLIGTGLLNERFVAALRQQTDVLERQRDDLRNQLVLLRAFTDQAWPFLVEDRLAGREVVLISYEGADGAAVAAARTALESAGAETVATLFLEPRLLDGTPDDTAELADVVGSSSTKTDVVRADAIDALARRLAVGPDPVAPEDDDLLTRLLSRGFLVAQDPQLQSTSGVGGPSQVMVLAGGSADEAAPPDASLVELVRGLAADDAIAAAAERTDSTTRLVSAIRDEDTSATTVTVDDVDTVWGQAALVLGIELAIDTGQGGHYGVGDDATQVLPSRPA